MDQAIKLEGLETPEDNLFASALLVVFMCRVVVQQVGMQAIEELPEPVGTKLMSIANSLDQIYEVALKVESGCQPARSALELARKATAQTRRGAST